MPKKVKEPAGAFPKRIGRPEIPFDQAIADYVCSEIAGTSKSMTTICQLAKEDGWENFPSDRTIWTWLSKHPSFFQEYTRAKELQQLVVMDETSDIADDGRNDFMERLAFNGSAPTWEINGEAIGRSRLRIENKRWVAAHLNRKTFGDYQKIDQTLDVSDDMKDLLSQVNGKTRTK